MKRQSNLILKGTSIYIILALYTLFLPSCQKDVVMPIEHTETYVGKNTNADFKIKSAQAWFNNNLSTFNTVKLDTIQPMWDKALVYENRIEMPYLINGKSNRKSLDGQIERLLSKERLVMIKKGNTNDYFIFVINYFPSKESNIDINKIDISNFMTERFDGKIMISTLNKKITDMILFKEGKIIENVSALDNRNNIQLRDKRCIYYDDYNCSSQLVVDWNPTTFTITYSTRMVCEWGKFEICWDNSRDNSQSDT